MSFDNEVRYDGKYVLRTNTNFSSNGVALAYRDLWMIEYVFRNIKDIFKIRPVFHWTSSRVRGHIFICFLAFLLTCTFQRKLSEMRVKESIWEVIQDVGKIKAVKLYLKVELRNSHHLKELLAICPALRYY